LASERPTAQSDTRRPEAPPIADRRIPELLAAAHGNIDLACAYAGKLSRFYDVDLDELRTYAARWDEYLAASDRWRDLVLAGKTPALKTPDGRNWRLPTARERRGGAVRLFEVRTRSRGGPVRRVARAMLTGRRRSTRRVRARSGSRGDPEPGESEPALGRPTRSAA
jgi:hypothetical protein